MVNNRTPTQTRWGLGNPDDDVENAQTSCTRCSGTGSDRSGQPCSDCLGSGTTAAQLPK